MRAWKDWDMGSGGVSVEIRRCEDIEEVDSHLHAGLVGRRLA